MELKLKMGADGVMPRCMMALLALACGFFCAYFAQLGMLLIPLAAAPLATVFMLERGKTRCLTILLPLLMAVTDLVFNGIYSYSALSAIIVASLIYVTLDTGLLTKGESVLVALLLLSVLAFLMFILYGCLMVDKLDFSASLDYYRQAVVDLEASWQDALNSILMQSSDSELAEAITPEMITDLYYNYVHSVYSIVMIILLVLIGFSYKLFSAIFVRYVERKSYIYRWRFTLSPIYAYSLLLLFVLQLFATDYSPFAVVVTNLTNVMTFLFAYVGLMFADAYFRMKSNGERGGKLIIIIAVLLIGSVAITALALVGVVASIMMDKVGGSYDGETTSNQGGNR